MSRLEELIAALCPDGVEHKTIRELCDVYTGGEVPEDYLKGVNPNGEYQYPIYSNGINEKSLYGFSKKYRIKEDAVCFSSIGTIGFPTIRNGKFTPVIRLKVIVPKKESNLLLGFLKYSLEVANFQRNKSSVPNINADLIKNIVIPFPPLPVQKEIVRILDQYSAAEQELEARLDAELEAREKQYAYYRDALLDFSPGKPRIGSKHSRLNKLIETLCPDGVEYMQLGEISDIFIGSFIKKTEQDKTYKYPVYNGGMEPTGYYYNYNSNKNSIAISARGANCGFVNYLFVNFWAGNSCYVLKDLPKNVDTKYLFYYLKSNERRLFDLRQISGIPAINQEQLSRFIVSVPPLPVQNEIVRILDQFDTLVNDIKQGLPAEISARRQQYEYYRDKLLTFKEKQP